MKKQLCSPLLVLFLVISSACFAQNKSRAKCISAKGYWVIENNIKAPGSDTIYFYNNDNVMIYHEKIEGIKLNTDRRKTLLKLKAALEQAVVAWEKGEKKGSDSMMVMTVFRK
jgi:hypothetical protein